MKHILNIIVVTIASALYAGFHWYENFTRVNWITSTEFTRPFVYRQLVPLIVRFLSGAIRADVALILVVTLAGVGFYVSLRLLGLNFGIQNELWALLVVLAGLSMFGDFRAAYDLMTAFLWTLALLFLFQNNKRNYAILFPILCLNRIETAILLIVLWVVFYRKDVMFVGYQISVFVVMYAGLNLWFADNYGSSMWVEPMENINRFLANPLLTLCHLLVFASVMAMAIRNWNNKDLRLKTSFLVLLPVFFGLYLVFGQAFEVRVFWEVMPIIGAMIVR